ncbi:Cullin-like protein 5 [Raphanus sativus]|nr:Cullin-like protein 5 [Raphanus sativus]
MYMFRWNPFRDSGFLKKPFLDSTAEFYAAEAKQVLEQSSDLPQYLKYVDQRVGEEKKKCINLPLFSCFQDELLEVVNRELLEFMLGFEKLMDERPWEALRMMYDLFSQAEEGSSLAEFKAHVGKICCTYFSEDPLLEMTFHKCFEGLGVYVSPGSSPFRDPSADEMYRSPHWLF